MPRLGTQNVYCAPRVTSLPLRAHAVKALVPLALATLATAFPRSARAEPPDALDIPVIDKLSPWDHGKPRAFVAGKVDLGVVYARPAVMVGYGRPHWEWFGAEAYVFSTNSFGATYAGARASLPFLDFTMGVRDTLSYRRSFLPDKAHYEASDVDHTTGDRARYRTYETELSGVLPAPWGYFVWGVVGETVFGVPRGQLVYEEGIRVVMRPPFALDLRFGYVASVGKDGVAKIGFLTETIVMPNRDGPVERVGPVVTLAITDHLEGLGVFTTVVRGPDSLGLLHSPYGILGVRYRFASGDASPGFP